MLHHAGLSPMPPLIHLSSYLRGGAGTAEGTHAEIMNDEPSSSSAAGSAPVIGCHNAPQATAAGNVCGTHEQAFDRSTLETMSLDNLKALSK